MYFKLLILQEKHGNWYFDVPTEEVLYETCQKIVKARYETGYYTYSIKEPKEPQKPENLERQPAYVKKAYNDALEDYKTNKRDYLETLDEKHLLDEALKGGKAAWQFLDCRSHHGHEYERVGLEYISNPDEYNI